MTKIIIVTTIFVFLLVVGPLVTIWALNSLFSLNIESSFANWFAVIWLSMIVSGGLKYNSK